MIIASPGTTIKAGTTTKDAGKATNHTSSMIHGIGARDLRTRAFLPLVLLLSSLMSQGQLMIAGTSRELFFYQFQLLLISPDSIVPSSKLLSIVLNVSPGHESQNEICPREELTVCSLLLQLTST